MATEARKAITSYVTDMLALENHIQKAIAGQIEDLDDEHADFVSELRQINTTVESHISALEALAERREIGGQGIADAVKRVATTVLGAGAAAVDFVRTEKLPKNLRDDYAAISLASIGYVMLYTTATSLDDNEVANLAKLHLQDHAKCTMTLHNLIPGAVIRFLREDGLPARTDVLPQIASTIESVWQSESGVPSADDVSPSRREPSKRVDWDKGATDLQF